MSPPHASAGAAVMSRAAEATTRESHGRRIDRPPCVWAWDRCCSTGSDAPAGLSVPPATTRGEAARIATGVNTVWASRPPRRPIRRRPDPRDCGGYRSHERPARRGPCLLYTSDAADDLLCVDLGGRRI